MNIIERLDSIVTKAQGCQDLDLHGQAATPAPSGAIRCLNDMCSEIRSIVLAIKKGPSEGAILAAEQAYHDAPDAAAQVDGIADAIRAAWYVDLGQEQQVDF